QVRIYWWRRLTVKLRGRTQPPHWSRGCTLSSSARGETTEPHATLQRLLGAPRFDWALLVRSNFRMNFLIAILRPAEVAPFKKVCSLRHCELPRLNSKVSSS